MHPRTVAASNAHTPVTNPLPSCPEYFVSSTNQSPLFLRANFFPRESPIIERMARKPSKRSIFFFLSRLTPGVLLSSIEVPLAARSVRESGARARKTVNVVNADRNDQRRPLSLKSIDSFTSYRFAAFRVTQLLADSDRM